MKKLVSVLLMLALLCGGVAAMAAEIPSKLTGNENVEYSVRSNRGSSRMKLSGEDDSGKYSAYYYFSGALESYEYTFADCECKIAYNPFGERTDAPIRKAVESAMYVWDAEQGKWLHENTGAELEGYIHNPEAHTAPVSYAGVKGTRPEENAHELLTTHRFASYAELKNWALTYFASSLEEERSAGGEVFGNGQNMLVKKDGVYGRYKNGKFVETYVDSLVINLEDEQCWLGGDARFGINTEGFYDWETGELDHYKFYTADRSMNAVYTVKNVLLSTELWDSEGGYWGFNTEEDYPDKWVYNPSGDFRGAVVTDPTTEVLEKILHAPEPATYESACVTSESQLKEDQKGVPFILASASDINNATVKTTAEQTGARSTEFDISLLNASGKEVDLAADSVTLTLGYPAGMPQDVSKNYEFAVVHTLDDGTEEVMTTMTNNVKLTANGPQVTATGFSPYTVIWGTADELAEYAKKAEANMPGGPGDVAPDGAEAMPQTGDDSMLLIWAALLAVSCTALVMKKRSRA